MRAPSVMNNIGRLLELGQSAWLDFLDHALLESGELRRMIEEDCLRGLTSNPTIFQKAIAGSGAYDDFIRSAGSDKSDAAVFERLQVQEVRRACDAFAAMYEESGGADGFVSLEVSPALAYQTRPTVEQARKLWSEVGRPNLMVKIPGTREGIPAIEQCLAEGININITLLFGVDRYVEVANAYLRALELRTQSSRAVDRIASVASFFVSRVDTKVDAALESAKSSNGASVAEGAAAIANAKLAFAQFEQIFAGERWRRLEASGARPQRLLWASTSPKNPRYSALHYVEALIGPHTVDTMTRDTFREYLARGNPEVRLPRELEKARACIEGLGHLGIDFAGIARELEEEGVRAFAASHESAMGSIAQKRQAFGNRA